MKTMSLMHLILVAVALSAAALPVEWFLVALCKPETALKLCISLLILAYLAYLLQASDRRAGKITLYLLIAGCLTIASFWKMAVVPFLMLSVFWIWLARSLLFYSRAIHSIIDLSLCAGGLAWALWAYQHSASLIAAVWCFFLIQALWVFIPRHRSADRHGDHSASEHFERSYDAAEAALKILAQRSPR